MKTLQADFCVRPCSRLSVRAIGPTVARFRGNSRGYTIADSGRGRWAVPETPDWTRSEWFQRWEELAYGALAREETPR
jgi:hypothetical protein